MDQDKNFYCVIDGLVQVHTRTGNAQQEEDDWEEGVSSGYQLLNEVGSGGTLSSLFTILSLFTENVRMSWKDSETSAELGPNADTATPPIRTRSHRSDSDVSSIALEDTRSPDSLPARHTRQRSNSSSSSTAHGSDATVSPPNEFQYTSSSSSLHTPGRNRAHGRGNKRPEHGAVALAVEDATLAVIPAEAFRRLTKKFPKASAHIVQGQLYILFMR